MLRRRLLFRSISSCRHLPTEFAERACSREPSRLRALRAETHALLPYGAHMLSGAQQGRLLHMLARLGGARRVLEVGSFTGYSTMWLASALPPSGTLVACERDERAAAAAQRHLTAAGLADRVELRLGDALETLAAMDDEPPFDLVFVDADKKRYAQYYELVLSRGLLARDGVLLADNVLWKWQVLEASSAAAPEGSSARERFSLAVRDAMHAYNGMVASDARVHQVVVPLRDGLNIAQQRQAQLCDDDEDGDHATEPHAEEPATRAYLRNVCSREPSRLRALRAETHALLPYGAHMLSGAQQGRLLHMLARLGGARRVLEVGSFTGYSTMWLASALPPSGTLVACERDERAAAAAQRHLTAAGLADRVELWLGDHALERLAARRRAFRMETESDEPQYDLVVVGRGTEGVGPEWLSELLRLLAPCGLLVLQASPDAFPRWLSDSAELSVVCLPSPDADGTVVALVGHPQSRLLDE